ncbi:MAG: hypothetical protein J0I41_16280 [Filimonas sp.]|nr:hypothetical protein [Filimonas sp.]
MLSIPPYIAILFILTTLLALVFIYHAANKSKTVLVVSLAWLLLQGIISMRGFYENTTTVPPRFVFLVPPALLFILVLFVTKKGRQFIDALNIKTLTWLHVVRIPVEIILYLLFVNKTIPQLMTFEGRNFDILAGISAPIIALIAFSGERVKKRLLLYWNIICICLLLNIVVNAILSAPLPFQQFAFDQPNIALLYFPFTWLPCYVVPVVLFAHLASVRQILKHARN